MVFLIFYFIWVSAKVLQLLYRTNNQFETSSRELSYYLRSCFSSYPLELTYYSFNITWKFNILEDCYFESLLKYLISFNFSLLKVEWNSLVAGVFSLLFNIDYKDMVSKQFNMLQHILILPDSFEFPLSFPCSLKQDLENEIQRNIPCITTFLQ